MTAARAPATATRRIAMPPSVRVQNSHVHPQIVARYVDADLPGQIRIRVEEVLIQLLALRAHVHRRRYGGVRIDDDGDPVRSRVETLGDRVGVLGGVAVLERQGTLGVRDG